MNLTENISFEEMVSSGSYPELVSENKIEAEVYIHSIQQLATELQKIRDFYGKPLRIHSGFRGPKLNAKVGGVKSSQHLFGEAADFTIVGIPVEVIFQDIINGNIDVTYSQVIQENDRWIHMGIVTDRFGKEGETLRFDGKHYYAA